MFDLTITLQENKDLPLYEQLYRAIVRQIQAGELKAGEKLPSKRFLCQHLTISHSTVETAYGLLMAEGYIESLPRACYRVCEIIPMKRVADHSVAESEEEKEVKQKRPGRQQQLPEEKAPGLSFSTGAVDTKIFPYASWAKIYKEVIYQNPQLLQRGDAQGDWAFRQTLSLFLQEYRGVRCHARQIVVGAGMEYLLDLLLQLFPHGSRVALEDPGYSTAYRVVQSGGKIPVSIPLDEQGMDVGRLQRVGADLAYVTPSHQFPMGITMPAGRRSQLLEWADTQGAWIIEDDYDSEFRYRSRPISAMQGMDHAGRVVYIGTFSRSIAPSIRAAYMVLPEPLLEAFQKRFGRQASTISRFEQHALERFIRQGLYLRHLRRSTNVYKKRMLTLKEKLMQIAPNGYVSGEEAGLHLLFHIPGVRETDVVLAAARRGLSVHGLSEYCHSQSVSKQEAVLVLGFAGLQETEMDQAVKILQQSITCG